MWVQLHKDSKYKEKSGANLSSDKVLCVEMAVTNTHICQTNTLQAAFCNR